MKSKSLRKTIINIVVMIYISTFIISACYNLFAFYQPITSANDNSLIYQSQKESTNLFNNYKKVEDECTTLSSDISSLTSYDSTELITMLKKRISGESFITGGGIWFEPYIYKHDQQYYGPYIYKNRNRTEISWNYDTNSTEYFQCKWYTDGLKAINKPVWSEPYIDEITKVDMITVSSAIVKDGKAIGVTTMDIGIKELSADAEKIKIGKTGYAFVVTSQGSSIGYSKFDSSDIKKINTLVGTSDKTKLTTVKFNGKDNYFAASPIGDTGMKLVMIVPKSEIGFNVQNFIAANFITFITAFALFYILLSSTINKKILNPLDLLVKRTKSIGAGNFNEKFSEELLKRSDEFGELSQAVYKMQQELSNSFSEIQKRAEELDKRNSEIACQSDEISVLYGETTAMNDELNELLSEIKKNYLSTVSALANAIEAKDTYTKGHCERVTKYSMAIANRMNFDQQELETLEFAALLHDIGKIGIPADIINKPSRLTAEEFEKIKLHPKIGYRILEDVEFLDASRNILLQHHERIDGKGYPNGLHDGQINILAKIMAAADSYDAMTSDRPYRKSPMTKDEAIKELIKNKGLQFDAHVVDVFVEILRSDDLKKAE